MSHPTTEKLYAVVVPKSVQKCHDILPASSNLVNRTPCPFGLSVYAWEEHPSVSPVPSLQPLIFVSEQAAHDRAPAKSLMNGIGVRPGWYLIAKPGRFEVHASRVNREHYGLPWEDSFALSLEVEGQDTHVTWLFRQEKDTPNGKQTPEIVFKGFLDARTAFSPVRRQCMQVIRPFAFETVQNALEDKGDGPSDVGTVTLKAEAGVAQLRKGGEKARTFSYSGKQVSAKAVAKEGRTMKVSRNCSTAAKAETYSPYILTDRRKLPEAEVTIFVRERSWLRSRRLIDENDQPVTYAVFRQLLQAAQPPIRTPVLNQVIDADQEPTRKKPKIKKQVLLCDDVVPVQPGEIIDLT